MRAVCWALLLTCCASAHEVAVGIGTRCTLDFGPERIRVRVELGYSPLSAFDARAAMDLDGDARLSPGEREAWLGQLCARLLGELGLEHRPLASDGPWQKLALRLDAAADSGALRTRSLETGALPEEAVAFEVWLELQSQPLPGGSALWFRNTSFVGSLSSHELMVPMAQLEAGLVSDSFLQDLHALRLRHQEMDGCLLLRQREVRFEYQPAAAAARHATAAEPSPRGPETGRSWGLWLTAGLLGLSLLALVVAARRIRLVPRAGSTFAEDAGEGT